MPGGPCSSTTLFQETRLTDCDRGKENSPAEVEGTVLTIDISVAEDKCGMDVVQQLELHIVRIEQAIPEPFP